MTPEEIILELQGAKEILLLMAGYQPLSRERINDTIYYICRNMDRVIAEIKKR